MLTADATVKTSRPSRYLVQLCRHMSHGPGHLAMHLRRHKHHEPTPEAAALAARTEVEWTTSRGLVTFGWGATCEVLAKDQALVFHAEAEDAAGLNRAMEVMTRNLERIGRGDGLRLPWSPPPSH